MLTLCVCVRRRCAYDTQTSGGNWPKMTPNRVDECLVYAVTDIVGYRPGWAAPLMLASNLLKGRINTKCYFDYNLKNNLAYYTVFFDFASIIFQNSVDNFEIVQKRCSISVWGAFPLKLIFRCLHYIKPYDHHFYVIKEINITLVYRVWIYYIHNLYCLSFRLRKRQRSRTSFH